MEVDDEYPAIRSTSFAARSLRLPRLGIVLAAATTISGLAGAGMARPAAAAAPPGLSLGLTDEGVLDLPADARARDLTLARSSGATTWRFQLAWSNVARTAPPSAVAASDPDWTGYDWTAIDDKLKAVVSAGMTPLLYIFSAPAWAEGPGRPPVGDAAPVGTWRPDAAQLRLFAVAAAKRYSGSHPDPVGGARLPAVTTWQAWNEPNLWLMVSPQWVRVSGKWVAASPGIYRGIQNAIYSGIKSVTPKAKVITAGTAPYGDLTEGTYRIPPALFWRDLLCVGKGTRPKARRCPVIKFDAVAHHPYSIGPPTEHAANADDMKVADSAKLTRLLGPAIKLGTIRPAGAKPLWITETGWDSTPDPAGVSLDTQAQYLEGALRVFNDAGIKHVLWFDLRDEAPSVAYGFADTYQSGLLLRGTTPADDVAKPSLTAFRFPFTVTVTKGIAKVWGMAPKPGAVQLQSRSTGAAPWTSIKTLTAANNRAFQAKLKVTAETQLRAAAGADASLPWAGS